MNSIDKTRQDKTRQDKTRQDKTRQDKTRQDKTRQLLQHKKECQVVVLGNMDNTIDHTFESANRVYDKNNLCPTIPTCAGGGIQPKIIEETKCCVAMRGRNPDNPSDRTRGAKMEQRLEMNKEGLVNTLTTVQKDNLCLEIKQATKEGSIKCKVGGCYDASYPESKTRRGRVQEGGDVTPTITAQGGENINYVETQYRIRKLTPKECWRLMGYTDADFDKASAVNSNTQLYKEAGNAIVKQVLMAIFLQLGIQGKKKWNNMTIEEREKLVRSSVFSKK